MICAWCELRNDVRHFRTDRVVSADVLDESFSIPETVIAKWLADRTISRLPPGYAVPASAPYALHQMTHRAPDAKPVDGRSKALL